MRNVGVFIREKVRAKPSNPSHLPTYEDGTDRVFRNVGIENSDARELPRRKHRNIRKHSNYNKERSLVRRVSTCTIYLYTHTRAVGDVLSVRSCGDVQ